VTIQGDVILTLNFLESANGKTNGLPDRYKQVQQYEKQDQFVDKCCSDNNQCACAYNVTP